MLSAVVVTHNEEKNIASCLKALKFCDEIVVIDDESTDKTAQIAKKHGASVISHSLNNDFSKQRNFGLKAAKGEWVLFVDADEVVTHKLAQEILHTISSTNQLAGYLIKRRDYLWGKPLLHGEQGNIQLLRLGRKNEGTWYGAVHEVWDMQGKVGVLQNPLLHYPHEDLEEFLKEINIYTTLRSEELYKKGIRVGWWDILFYTKAKFIQDYVWKMGFLDGIEGFIAALIMSMHSFLVRAKVWELQNNN